MVRRLLTFNEITVGLKIIVYYFLFGGRGFVSSVWGREIDMMVSRFVVR